MSKSVSRRHSARRKARQRNLMPIVVLGSILALVAAGLLLAMNRSDAGQPAVPVTVKGSPRLHVDQERIDFGDVPVGKMVTASFNLSNTGDQPLVFSHPPVPTVVEGCCPPRIQSGVTTLQPGQQTTLSMEFTMQIGMDGPHDFRIGLQTNDPSQPSKELVVLSNWVR
jgi:hypothetical protein